MDYLYNTRNTEEEDYPSPPTAPIPVTNSRGARLAAHPPVLLHVKAIKYQAIAFHKTVPFRGVGMQVVLRRAVDARRQ